MKHPLDYESDFMFWFVSMGGSILGGMALAAIVLAAAHFL